jgi:phosphotransferase system enzyme I (PtsI)
LAALERGAETILDGTRGELVVGASREDRARYSALARTRVTRPEHYAAETVDGHRVALLANTGIGAAAIAVERQQAEGIGLMRSEFLFLNRVEPPGEEEQFDAFRRVAHACPGRKVVIRTADFGGDKMPLFFAGDGFAASLRGLRFCLERRDFFKTHLRAILRASAYGDVRVMFPMVPGLATLRQAKAVLNEAMTELEREGVSFKKPIEVGVMIEVPSAAIMASALAGEADFFSIGTNDLCQYTLALDRASPLAAGALPPSVLHLIEMIVAGAHGKQKPVSVCGEAAGDANAIPILIGLGIDELSMEPGRIPAARERIRQLSYADCLALVERALKALTPDEVQALTA